MGQTDDFVEVNISAGKTVFVKGDDTNKVYKITHQIIHSNLYLVK